MSTHKVRLIDIVKLISKHQKITKKQRKRSNGGHKS
jgi:hypothetical protein